MITISGVGSGLDIDSIVSQLMELEREPVKRLEQRRERLDVELSAFASAKSLMGELATAAGTIGDASKIAPFVASSTDEAVFTATAGSAAATERHDIEVISLASAHRVATTGHESADASVGAGTWSFSSGDNAFDIELASGADSLATLRDAINESTDNRSIVASTLDVDGGTRLVLTARETGAANAIEAVRTTGGGGPTAATPFGEEIVPAEDARLRVDGFDVTRTTNTVSDVIEGVTLELRGVGTGELDNRRDTEAMTEGLTAFVQKYNALQAELSKFSDDALQGERMPRNADLQLRAAFATDVDMGDGTSLAPVELGFTFDRYGTLSLDTTTLTARQGEGFERLIDAYSRPVDGFAARLSQVLEQYTSAEGRIASREQGIERQRAWIDDSIEQKEYRLERVEERLRRQFSAMDTMVGTLQSTSGLLAERLGA